MDIYGEEPDLQPLHPSKVKAIGSSKKIISYILLPAISIILFFLAITGILLPIVEKNFINDRKNMVREIINVSWSFLTDQYFLETSGEITREKAQANVISYFKNLRYGEDRKDYFWIIDRDVNMIMHPYLRELDNQNLSSYQDPEGTFLFQTMAKTAAENGEGFVSYLWQWKDEPGSFEEKISFIRLHEPWGWILGTGLYVVDIEKELADLKKLIFLFFIGILFILGLIILLMSLLLIKSRRKQVETQSALFRRNEFYRILFDASGDAILLIDQNMIIRECNKNALVMFGYESSGGFLGGSVLNLSTSTQEDEKPSEKRACDYLGQAAGQENKAVHFEWRHVKQDGTVFPAEVTLTKIPRIDETFYLAMIRDMTEKRQIRERLKQSEKMDSLGQLAGGVAHDFNNFLGGIIGSAELLQEELAEQEIPLSFVSMILNAADKAADLSRKLLTFARKEMTLKVPVDINTIIEDMIAILRHTIDRRIIIKTDFDPQNPRIRGDVSQIQTALLNLAINARDAMPDGGEISITSGVLYLDEEYCLRHTYQITPGFFVRIILSDTGSGIPAAYLNKIFDPFFTTKETGKGTGLGLASVYGTIIDHQGQIQVYSEEGRGTTFNLYLPLEEENLTAGLLPSHELKNLAGKRVLLVDDDEIIRESASQILTRAGVHVVTAGDGRQGLDLFIHNKNSFDLVLLDMIMPRVNGNEVLVKIKKLAPSLPVLIASGFTLDQGPAALIQKGASGFVQKPFHRESLLKAVSDALLETASTAFADSEK